MRKRIVHVLSVALIIFAFSACSSSEDEQKAADQQQSPREVGRQMAEQMKQPIIDAESAKRLSTDRLRELEEATKE